MAGKWSLNPLFMRHPVLLLSTSYHNCVHEFFKKTFKGMKTYTISNEKISTHFFLLHTSQNIVKLISLGWVSLFVYLFV